MALDMKKLKQMQENWKSAPKGGVGANMIWKPTKGVNKIRIIPLNSSPDIPIIERKFTYLGGKTLMSPLSFGNPDPIDEFGDKLRSGGKLSKEEWSETKQFKAQSRWFALVVDRAEPGELKYWGFSKTVRDALVEIMLDEDYGDISDAKQGRDIKVNFTPKDESITGFAKTEIMVSPNTSPLSADATQIKEWLTNQPDLDTSFPQLTYDQLKDKLEAFCNNGTTATEAPIVATQENDEDWGPSPSAEKSKATSKKGAVDVEADFQKMFASDDK